MSPLRVRDRNPERCTADRGLFQSQINDEAQDSGRGRSGGISETAEDVGMKHGERREELWAISSLADSGGHRTMMERGTNRGSFEASCLAHEVR
jgi:hypothetical protein